MDSLLTKILSALHVRVVIQLEPCGASNAVIVDI